jgi:ppGpp synthetase/RelA/SpoT-type nucleotidyltranferase
VTKSWESVVDKLYRYNIEENAAYPQAPITQTTKQQADDVPAKRREWILPSTAHLFADDLLRTKIVVPFVDQVATVGASVRKLLEEAEIDHYLRFHAKDSGYHAQHYYGLIPVPNYGGRREQTTVVLEVKILTKMQDLLGELTHLLYEQHRRGEVPAEKKRKFAWDRRDPDFLAAYLGHAGHFLESSIADLKDQVLERQTAT